MSTGEGENPRDGQSRPEGDNRRGGDRIAVGSPDDSVARIQLAARWAEGYASDGESLASMLRRFRTAYEYLDAVIHGVDPPELDSLAEESRGQAPTAPRGESPQPQSQPGPPPPWSNPAPQEPGPPPAEPRPWG